MSALNSAFSALPITPRMPALFVGHGSPMNAIEDNDISRTWRKVGDELPVPKAILCVSAHWMTRGTTLVHVAAKPRTIHDFGGFPQALFDAQYAAPGAPDIAAATLELLQHNHSAPDEEWGLDHGAWSVLIQMFPKANIPVYQLSLDLTMPLAGHLQLAKELKVLRERGVLIVGSGNVVHNLRAMNFHAKPYDWNIEFDSYIAKAIDDGDTGALVDVSKVARAAALAHPSIEHYLPILYAAGVRDAADDVSQFNATYDLASLSMRSFVFQ